MSAFVQCVPKKRLWPEWCRHRILNAKKALPFAESPSGRYAHRVRYVEVHLPLRGETKSHLAAGCWCGQTVLVSKRRAGRLVAEPTDGYLVCATCEGRAIGAGQLGSRLIAGREVIFQPQRAGAE